MTVPTSMFSLLVSAAVTAPAAAQAKAPAPAVQPISRATFLANFSRMGPNDDSKIVKAEIETPQQAEAMVEIMARDHANFDRFDTDKNGIVSAVEIRAGGIIKK